MAHLENYQPENPPEAEAPELARYILGELQRLSILTDLLVAGHAEETFVAPGKPRTGDVRLADGTSWNPGSGRGVYWFDETGSTWNFMG